MPTSVSLQILADEDVAASSIARLRGVGIDVASVRETDPGHKGSDVIALARRLGRVLLTFDSDIGERIYLAGDPAPPGVIYLRFIQPDPEETALVVASLLDGPMVGLFSTYRNGRVRQRPLP